MAACVTVTDDVSIGSNDPCQWKQEIPVAYKQDSAHIGADILEVSCFKLDFVQETVR